MRKSLFFILYSLFIFSAHAESFLTAQSFPKTAADLSFVDRVAVLTDGYAPWESDYDEKTHRCIKNCAYPGLTIEDEVKLLERNTRIAQQYVADSTPVAAETPAQAAPQFGQVLPPEYMQSPRMCTLFDARIPDSQNLPLSNPLSGATRITSQFGQRINPVTHRTQVHTGVDFAAPIGTPVYSPAGGVVEKVWTDATCGMAMRVKHAGGFTSAYCHLSECSVKPGDTVSAGCLVAKTGNTGRSTGPHLHYGLYYNGEWVNPSGFINN